MPEWLRNDLFSAGSELIAACHDIGKVSPTFQEKIYRATKSTTNYQNNSLPELKNADPEQEKQWGGHAGVSQAAANAILRNQVYAKDIRKYVPLILGQHHGSSPKLSRSASSPRPWGVCSMSLHDKSCICVFPTPVGGF